MHLMVMASEKCVELLAKILQDTPQNVPSIIHYKQSDFTPELVKHLHTLGIKKLPALVLEDGRELFVGYTAVIAELWPSGNRKSTPRKSKAAPRRTPTAAPAAAAGATPASSSAAIIGNKHVSFKGIDELGEDSEEESMPAQVPVTRDSVSNEVEEDMNTDGEDIDFYSYAMSVKNEKNT